MTKNRSISYHLARSLILATVLLWLAMVIYVAFQAHHELAETLDYILIENAIRSLPLAAEIAQNGVLPALDVVVPNVGEFDELAEALDFAVLGAEGQVVYSETIATLPGFLQPGFSTWGGLHSYVLMDNSGEFGVAVFETAGLRTYTIYQILPSMILTLVLIVPVLAAIAYLLSRKALAPILKFATEVGARDGRNLSPIAITDTPAELAPVASEVEKLIARVHGTLEAERSFSAECAHELRTPIAGALAQVQAAQAATDAPVETLDAIETSLRNLADLAETLLQHSRVEHGFALSDKEIDVVQILDVVLLESFFTSMENDRFDIDYPASMKMLVKIDTDACAMALRNLLTNALRYSPPTSMVRIRIGTSHIEVINASKRIPPELLHRLGERFVRAADDKQGTGLGLAITRAIMEDIGGALELRSPAPGRPDGFAATLIFQQEQNT